MSKFLDDPRFAHLVSDPRFKNLPKSEKKVKIDKRFQSMFNDKKFKLKYTVDKYGRKVNNTTSEDLKKYYELETDSEEDEKEERRQEEIKITKESKDSEDDEIIPENDQLNVDDGNLPLQIKEKLINSGVDFARGEGRILTDSSSDEETSSDEDDEMFIEHVWGELDAEATTTEESTKRLAACNMDWDRIRASDILVLCSSFLPPSGTILSVKIFPSEYGKERLKEEELNGPSELLSNLTEINNEINSDSDDDGSLDHKEDAEEGDDYHMEKLRQYQLNRLKYYYAVIECDSVNTADKLYRECDGIEYESTATKFDLRFIPDDTNFDESEIKDICTELPDMNKYKPRLFTTTALQQAKVELTWDETCLERREIGDKLASGKMDDVTDADLRKFVAYSSEEEEEDEIESENSNQSEDEKKLNEKDKISKYKSLLEEINNKEKEKKNSKFEMEYTWGINVGGSKNTKPDFIEEKPKKNLTPIEKALEKKHEKNKKRKQERKKRSAERNKINLESGESSDDEDVPDGIDINDPYFAEEFKNGDFQPTKKSSKKIIKSKSTANDDDDDDDDKNTKELELLLDDGDDNKNHFSLEKILKSENATKSNKKRRKHQLKKSKHEIIENKSKEDDDNFKINTKDERFQAIYNSHLFSIDPTNSHFKKTKGMEEIIEEKLKRRKNPTINNNEEIHIKKSKKEIENNLLIKSLKRKLQAKMK